MINKFKVTKSNIENNKAEIKISGAKNAILPLIIAKCLVKGKTVFKNVPFEIEDLKRICDILILLGLKIDKNNEDLIILNDGINNNFINNNLTKYSRYSSLFFGILSKFDNFKIGWCSGCNIGSGRPLDIHFDGFNNFGFNINENEEFIEFTKINKENNSYKMKFPSVGATFNFIFYSIQNIKTEEIRLENCAIEPEIENVILFLKKAGYKIKVYFSYFNLKCLSKK